jgi:hypothetical protein
MFLMIRNLLKIHYKKKDENNKDFTVQISVDDLYHPNYTNSFEQTRIGSIFKIILTPIFGILFIAASVIGYCFLRMWIKINQQEYRFLSILFYFNKLFV